MRRAQHSQRWSSRAALAAALAASALALTAPAALADKEIQAQPSNRFVPTTLGIDQGERVTFRNVDVAAHNVVADQRGPDGKPLFASPTIETNETAVVEGTQYLTTGSYGFLCTIHPFMTGTLNVSSAGTPVPRPGGGGADTSPPVLDVSVQDKDLDAVVERGKLKLKVTLDEAARVSLTAKARVAGHDVKLGGSTQSLRGGLSKLSLKLKKSARRKLDDVEKAKVTVAASASDGVGNKASDTAKRTLRG